MGTAADKMVGNVFFKRVFCSWEKTTCGRILDRWTLIRTNSTTEGATTEGSTTKARAATKVEGSRARGLIEAQRLEQGPRESRVDTLP